MRLSNFLVWMAAILGVVLLFCAPALGADGTAQPQSSAFTEWVLGIVAALVVAGIGGLIRVALVVKELSSDLKHLSEDHKKEVEARIRLNQKVNDNEKAIRADFGTIRDIVIIRQNTPVQGLKVDL